ncbi:peptidoglycan editing factor PgeF [Halobacillus seohaensis]|uniref:Purine nucleoside phosphorylase n=1 Tax=Halobacillus seohaensis TaxID=447421 RepID=A0ABW2EGK1_9BACI
MTEPFQIKSSKQFSCFNQFDVVAGMTSRDDGYSDVPFASLNMGLHVSDESNKVLQNRKSVANELQFPMDDWVMGEQVHGTSVKVVTPAYKGKGAFHHKEAVSGVDGLITKETDILLTAFYADCVPLFFIEPESGWLGIAHAGWKGSVNEMAKKMVDSLIEWNVKPEAIFLTIGPCISQKHYEVDQHVIDHISDVYRPLVSQKTSTNKFNLDLKELNKLIAIDSGILSENIEITNFCTYEEEASFFSHRRDHGQTGRMLAYIGRKG